MVNEAGSANEGLAKKLIEMGWALFQSVVSRGELHALATHVFVSDGAGRRCLLDLPLVQLAAEQMKAQLVAVGVLPHEAVAIQAIAFDKNPSANWKVTWHQDVMFPFARPVVAAGFELPTFKEGVNYARPPRGVLEELLAVRLHIDNCDEDNGPLRVVPGSHRGGIFRGGEIADGVAKFGERVCLAHAGEALLMRPLLLHASSPAREPRHRRVLHLVYHSGKPMAEEWHRAMFG